MPTAKRVGAPEAPDDTDWSLGAILAGFAFVAAFIGTTILGITVLAIGLSDDDNGDTPSAPAAAAGVIVATEFAFDPPVVQSGSPVELVLRNDGAAFHNLEIEGVDGFVLEVEPGETDAGTIELDAGNYVLWCSVPGHREAGMVGALVVE